MCLPLAGFHPGCLWSRPRCFLGFSQGRDDFQGCNRLLIRALRWEGSLCVPQTPPAVPAAPRRILCPSKGSQAAQPDPSSSPSCTEGAGHNSYLCFSLFPAVFLSPLYGKEHFPVWGRREGVFPARPVFAFAASGEVSWAGARFQPALPEPGGLCSAGGALSTGLGTGHCVMGLLACPGPQKIPGFVCSVLGQIPDGVGDQHIPLLQLCDSRTTVSFS